MHNTPLPDTIAPVEKPKKSFGRRLLKTTIWSLVLLIGLIIGTSVIIAAFFEDQVSKRLLAEINKQLETEMTVSEFNLSLLSGFPEASANLQGVELKDIDGSNLLEAENLAFRFKLFSLFSSNIKVNSVVVQH